MKRIFIRKLLVLAAIVLALQLLVGYPLAERHVPNMVHQCDELLKTGNEVLFLGDSTLFWTDARHDKDLSNTPSMLGALLPGARVGMLAHGAYHPRILAAYVDYIGRQKKRPELIIITLNPRAFSPKAFGSPARQFVRERVFLRARNKRVMGSFFLPLCRFGFIDLSPISWAEYDAMPLQNGNMPMGTVGDFRNKKLAPTLENRRRANISSYLQPVPANHFYLAAIRQIAKTTEKNGIKLLFYVTPVDIEGGEQVLPGRFAQEYDETIKPIVRTARDAGAALLDLSNTLDSSRFLHYSPVRLSEHLDDEGRHFVATRLAEYIKANHLLKATDKQQGVAE